MSIETPEELAHLTALGRVVAAAIRALCRTTLMTFRVSEVRFVITVVHRPPRRHLVNTQPEPVISGRILDDSGHCASTRQRRPAEGRQAAEQCV